jgi:hypothetical protein
VVVVIVVVVVVVVAVVVTVVAVSSFVAPDSRSQQFFANRWFGTYSLPDEVKRVFDDPRSNGLDASPAELQAATWAALGCVRACVRALF